MQETIIEQKIRELLVTVLNRPDMKTVSRNALLLHSVPELDSFSVVNVITQLEEIFNIAFDDEDLSEETFASLEALIECVYNRIHLSP